EGEAPPHFDFQCPLLSLPAAMRTHLGAIPACVPYLQADAALAAKWKELLGGDGGLKVGLVWAGASGGTRFRANSLDRRRSLTLARFAPLATVEGVRFVSLQKGMPAREAGLPPSGMRLDDFTDALGDFADTASLVSQLDLVITVDTAVAHLAGALAKPVW